MNLSERLRDQHGRVGAYVVITATAALAFGGLVLDGGLALAAKVRAMGQAPPRTTTSPPRTTPAWSPSAATPSTSA
jgi:hypothetical protein